LLADRSVDSGRRVLQPSNVILDRRTLLAAVALVAVGWRVWPPGTVPTAELALAVVLAAFVALLGTSERARGSRLAVGLLGAAAVCYGGYELATGRGTAALVLGACWVGLGLLTVLNQSGLAPWSDHDPVV
jgi:hypothetical protein